MLLSDTGIWVALDRGDLRVHPIEPSQVQPASVDLRLGDQFRVFTSTNLTHVDPENPPDDLTDLVRWDGQDPDWRLVLHPGEFVLGCTHEWVELGSGLAANLEGKSSRGRIGLVVHSTAGFIDPGFRGRITLELSNLSRLPIRLRPGMWVAQLALIPLSSPAARPYGNPELGSRYQDQEGAGSARPDQL